MILDSKSEYQLTFLDIILAVNITYNKYTISFVSDTAERYKNNVVKAHCFWSSPAVWIHGGETLSDYGIFRLAHQL